MLEGGSVAQPDNSSGEIVSLGEMYSLCAADPFLYCRHYFPKAFRVASPDFHRDYWDKVEDPSLDFFGAEMFRGSAKTTLSRAAISRRVAYGISRNILSVAISEAMAINTVRWIRRQVEFNTAWATDFQLQPGAKWADDHIEIWHGIEKVLISLIAKGMTSGLRGLNLDDWRPDLIYLDDICNEENTATEEQRKKVEGLVFGALAPSLAPKVEAPLRKMILTQTALHKEDPISMAHKDPSWSTVKYPKIYQDGDNKWHSSWPELYPIEGVLKEKEAYIQRRQVHIWLREYECKLVSSENAAFDVQWLKYWDVLPVGMRVYIGIDPARSSRKEAHRTACVAVGVHQSNTYLLDYMAQVGKNPDEIWTWLESAVRRWHPRQVGVESIAYQQMLAWYLRQKMLERNFFFPVKEVQDRRAKPDRIRQAYTGIAANGRFFVSHTHTQFITEFAEYADNVDSDLLDAGAQAIVLANPWQASGYDENEVIEGILVEEQNIPDLEWEGNAP